MDRSRLEFEPGLWLDASRAVWLEEARVLAVADLHLGYAWTHRAAGQLLPLSAREDTTERLLALLARYPAREVVLLGDIVHGAVRAPALQSELRRMALEIGKRTRLRLIGGNHDRRLAEGLAAAGITLEISEKFRVGPHLLLHGDGRDEAKAAAQLATCQAGRGRVIFGHEHPAIVVSDGVASHAKCPCFLAGPGLLILPAFSPWAAGTSAHEQNFLSPYARLSAPTQAVAIIAGKLLRMPLAGR